jgi:hypothetical protein
MYSVITNIYSKKTKGPTLMKLWKIENAFFWQLEIFDVYNTGDTAHTDTLFKWVYRYCLLLLWSVPARIIAAVNNIDAPLLTRVWEELDYRIKVGRLVCFLVINLWNHGEHCGTPRIDLHKPCLNITKLFSSSFPLSSILPIIAQLAILLRVYSSLTSSSGVHDFLSLLLCHKFDQYKQ